MRKLIILSAPLALLASPALAQTGEASGTVDITGSVAGRCMFTVNSKTIDLGEISLAADGKLNAAQVDNRTETLNGWCNNTAATISVLATELTNTSDAPDGFDNRVDYTATATAGDIEAQDDTLDPSAGAASSLGLFAGEITVTLSNASSPNNALMVAGDYSGNVVVTLTPTVVTPS